MTHHTRVALAALSAALLMALAITNASANRLSLSSSTFRVVWRTLGMEAANGGFSAMRCLLTLEGSFHSRTMRKIEGNLSGHITRAIIGTCTNGSATVHTETLPWHIMYSGFSGILPSISSIRLELVGTAYRIAQTIFFTFSCEARATTEMPTAAEASVELGGNIINALPDSTSLIPLSGGICPETEAQIAATGVDGQVTQPGATTRIRITLI